MANEVKIICKNVFKSENNETLGKTFTDRWIELINQYENRKGNTISPKKRKWGGL